MSDPIRFETGNAMLLGGLRRLHAFQHGEFGGQWRDFSALGPLPGQLGEHAYGVICGATATQCEYMCAVEVAALEVLPPGLGRMRIAPQTYAVFRHPGHVDALPHPRQAPQGRQALAHLGHAHKPDFERYGDKFDPKSGCGEVEVWLAVVPRQALA